MATYFPFDLSTCDAPLKGKVAGCSTKTKVREYEYVLMTCYYFFITAKLKQWQSQNARFIHKSSQPRNAACQNTSNTQTHQAGNFIPYKTMLLRLVLLLSVLGSSWIGWVNSHQESGEWSCESDEEISIEAEFKPGFITLDGHADDWKDIDGLDSSLLPALDPDDDKKYTGGKMTVKVRIFCSKISITL